MDVSIVIPTKNAGELLERTLTAIENQKTQYTYEVICVDSGSRDGTIDIIKRHNCNLYEIPASEYQKEETDVEISNSNGTKKYLRLIPSTIASGLEIVDNGKIAQVSIDGEWINDKMQNATSDSPFVLYISAQTMMNSSQNADEYEYTAEVFDSVTFKQRNLFNLD